MRTYHRDVVGVLEVVAAGMCRAVGRRLSGGGGGARAEHAAERGAELTTHRAVDDEVERVAEHDDHVDEQRSHHQRAALHNLQLKRVVQNQNDE